MTPLNNATFRELQLMRNWPDRADSALQDTFHILKLLNLDRDSEISVSVFWQHVTW